MGRSRIVPTFNPEFEQIMIVVKMIISVEVIKKLADGMVCIFWLASWKLQICLFAPHLELE